MYMSLKSAKIALFAWNIIVAFMAVVMFYIGYALSTHGSSSSFGYLLVCFSWITLITIFFGVLGALLDNIWLTVHSASIYLIMIVMEIISTCLLWISESVKSKYGPTEKFLKENCQHEVKTFVCDYVPVVSALNIIMIATQITGIIIIVYSIYFSKKTNKFDWTLGFILYVGLETNLTSIFSSYAVIKKRSRLLTKCAGIILISIVLVVIVLILFWSTEKSDPNPNADRIDCEDVFSPYLCKRETMISAIGIFLFILEVLCLAVTIILIRRLPQEDQW